MINHDTPWQEYRQNGEQIPGAYGDRKHFDNPAHIMGASHVWLWRKGQDCVEVLLQRRSESKHTWPGYWDISVAGHIDVGETPVVSAVREASEEIGLDIEPTKLIFVFSIRTPLAPNEIDHVFIYEVNESFSPAFSDGEVSEVRWVGLDELESIFDNPKDSHIVNQGKGYFSLLVDSLKSIAR